jgi:hypothetical protein
MLAVAGGAVVIWVLLMFGPPLAIPVTIHGSYATMLLQFVVGAAVLSIFSRVLLWPLLGCQVAYFAVIWVATIWRGRYMFLVSIGWTTVILGVLLAVLVYAARQPDRSDASTTPTAPSTLAAESPAM